MAIFNRLILSIALVSFLAAGFQPAGLRLTDPKTASRLPATILPITGISGQTPYRTLPGIPYDLISQESLFGYLEDLTSIQAYSGWRNSASRGEAEALDYVGQKMLAFSSLRSRGLELERQSFPVYLSTEIWESSLSLTINHREIEVPADGLRGSRSFRWMAAYFDSDGILGDSDPNPVKADGAPLLAQDEESLYALSAGNLKGRILFLNYAMIDTFVNGESTLNGSQLMELMDQGLAGVVLVTQYSNRAGVSRGSLVGEGGVFLYIIPNTRVPVLYVRLEDLGPAGIKTWEDLRKIEAAHMRLDADVYSPGKAGNLIARIPGADSSNAVILGAHIDSPNSPGAFDDGSGSAALLEVARVLNVSRVQPPVDVYLAWFGGHEIGTYGSAHFVSTHQELLDRTLGLVQMDGLGHPLEGKNSQLTLALASFGRFGDERLLMPDFLSKALASQGLSLERVVEYGPIADNTNFDAFNVPNVYLGYLDGRAMFLDSGYLHQSNHWHDPYETVDKAREVSQAFTGLVKVMLAAALEIGHVRPNLRVAPAPTRRALFVASHTENDTISTSLLRDLGMALAWEGFDVDLIPYAQAITPKDLNNAGVIVLPPTLDFPGQHNEKWSKAELALLEGYVASGGLLIVANSLCNYATKRCLDDLNEDAYRMNALLEPMGVEFLFGGGLRGELARAVIEHPLTKNADYLTLYPEQGAPFRMKTGLELIRADGRPMVGLINYGDKGGQVLVIADLGILQADSNGAKNLEFLKNIAHFASTR